MTHLPKQIGNCRNLEIIDLHWNKLDNFPYEIACLNKLKILNLKKNNIHGKVPEWLLYTNLQIVNIMAFS